MGRDWVLTMVLKGIVLRLTHGENDEKQNSMVRIGGDCSIYWSNQTIAGELSQQCQGRIAGIWRWIHRNSRDFHRFVAEMTCRISSQDALEVKVSWWLMLAASLKFESEVDARRGSCCAGREGRVFFGEFRRFLSDKNNRVGFWVKKGFARFAGHYP